MVSESSAHRPSHCLSPHSLAPGTLASLMFSRCTRLAPHAHPAGGPWCWLHPPLYSVLSGAVQGLLSHSPALCSEAPLQGGLSDLPTLSMSQHPHLPSLGLSVALTATDFFLIVVCLAPSPAPAQCLARSRCSAIS